MLDTAFARPLGDAGNPASWPFSVQIERVPGAFARAVVDGQYQNIESFVAAGRRLIARGAGAIITTCGFLVRHQQDLARALTVPVETSTLRHFESRQKKLEGGGRVAILTIDAMALDLAVRAAAGIPDDALIFSLPRSSHFVSAILGDCQALNLSLAEAEWVELAQACQRQHGDISAWLFECANMPPYASAVTLATGLPVFDTLTMGCQLYTRVNS